MKRLIPSLALVLMLTLVACGPAPGGSADTPEPTVTIEIFPTKEPQPTPTPAPTEVEQEEGAGSDLPEIDPAPNAIQQRVIDYVAAETGLDVDKIAIISQDSESWSDSSLGCPQPGVDYLQVITPGHLIEVDANNETLRVHTNEDASVMVICENPVIGSRSPEAEDDVIVENPPTRGAASEEEQPILPLLDGEAARVAEKALDYVATETGLARPSLVVSSFEQLVWRDSSIGCPEEGQMYMMVLTPGYRFQIDTGSEVLDVHTDRSGSRVAICPEGAAQDPAPSSPDS